jgi:chloramphenicol-sensitive protein RarD
MAIDFRSTRNTGRFKSDLWLWTFPWVALSLCTTFGLYGLLRKKSGTAAIPGLFIETVCCAARHCLPHLPEDERATQCLSTDISCRSVGEHRYVTLPQVWFGHAAQHLRLTTLGLQYLRRPAHFF